MRKLVLLAALLVSATVSAADKQCPSDEAAKAGMSPIAGFHEVIAPLWHAAYPDTNYEAMLKAGPDVEKAFGPIAGMEARMKNVGRKAAFLTNREEFSKLVKRYAAACRAGNKDSVYLLLPQLHDAFEKTASACTPTPYPEFDGLMVTVDLILHSHLPKGNVAGTVGSTETLVAKAKNLTPESLPESLQDKKESITPEFEAIRALAGRMQETCSKNEMVKYKALAEELKEKLTAFSADYL
ncbi:hypothetical protein C3F09_03410 [candidate division GN15 bacterium]|uniref:Secreted protein n=1 Tax=candidate division GN15 bacterium TaxID=2072418 RepID=A0A855X4G8_9BACT|nr:MAG: hypothetical protein C3F09_03410 [candidate division GN15 bacterium]